MGRAHLARAGAGGPHPGDEGGAGRRANRCGGEGIGVADALLREGIEVRGCCILVAVGSEGRAHVFGGDPENVGPISGGGFRGWGGKLFRADVAEADCAPFAMVLNAETAFEGLIIFDLRNLLSVDEGRHGGTLTDYFVGIPVAVFDKAGD